MLGETDETYEHNRTDVTNDACEYIFGWRDYAATTAEITIQSLPFFIITISLLMLYIHL
jgi:hypothetical protein